MTAASAERFHNPFASRHVRPGAIAYHFSDGENAATIVDRLASSGWRGQIVGPHGSGKSTLLAALLPEIEARERKPHLIALRDGQRWLPSSLSQLNDCQEPFVVIVDGYEQLNRWSRWRLARQVRRHGWGLLVTTHQPVDLPCVAQTSTTLELSLEIANQQFPLGEVISRQDVAQRFEARQGNLRDVLFDLYDLYEARRGSQQKVL